MGFDKGKSERAPASGVEPRPVLQVLREMFHADDTVFHRSPTMRRGRYGHEGVVVQLERARNDQGPPSKNVNSNIGTTIAL